MLLTESSLRSPLEDGRGWSFLENGLDAEGSNATQTATGACLQSGLCLLEVSSSKMPDMVHGRLAIPSLRPQFSGHETFPLRHLWLRKAYDAVEEQCKDGVAVNGVFSDPEAVARFGVGKNMVRSIRHWSLACGILEEVWHGLKPTPLAELLFGPRGVDPYLEHPATIWLMHWMVAGRAKRTTTWYWGFNYFSAQTFERDMLAGELNEYCRSLERKRASPGTIRRDVECFIRSYVPRAGASFTEELTEPLLGELGLIQQIGRSTFAFRRGPKPTLPDTVFLFALLEFWGKFSPTTSTLAFEAIAYEAGSPGRVFKLDENSVAERLVNIERITKGAISSSNTSGLRQVVKSRELRGDLALVAQSYKKAKIKEAA